MLENVKTLKVGSVVLVACRQNKRSARHFYSGRVRRVNAGGIMLGFDNPVYEKEYTILPINRVSFVLQIEGAQAPAKVVK